jgi:hypothetical protein
VHFRTGWKKIRNNKDKRRNKTYSRVVLNEATNTGVVNGQRSVRDRRELAVAMHIMSTKRGLFVGGMGGRTKPSGVKRAEHVKGGGSAGRGWLKND